MKNYLPNILVTGANGQLARSLLERGQNQPVNLIMCHREQLNILNKIDIEQKIQRHRPDLIINTAAYTAVDEAERNEQQAMEVNHQGAQNIALLCKAYRIPLFHLSTDYVFDGKQTIPYTETHPVNPINVYGVSKYLGEEAVRKTLPNHIILRVSGLFGKYGHNFLKTILRLAQEKNELGIVADQITCPTDTNDIADAIFTMINNLKTYGTFHFCSTPPLSWHAFAQVILETVQAKKEVTVKHVLAISSADYASKAKRPCYSVLDCQKISDVYGIKQPAWEKGLREAVTFLLEIEK